MRKIKINSYLKFPTHINMKKYTAEALGGAEDLPDQPYEYSLRGTVIHSGTSEGGHYYCFIQNRETGKWLEFNDHIVKEFRVEDLKEECFGGTGYISASSVWGAQTFQRSRSAYMLVYERVKPLPVPEETAEEIAPIDMRIKGYSRQRRSYHKMENREQNLGNLPISLGG